jgi:TATA-binding protein-associated factor Taf7
LAENANEANPEADEIQQLKETLSTLQNELHETTRTKGEQISNANPPFAHLKLVWIRILEPTV